MASPLITILENTVDHQQLVNQIENTAHQARIAGQTVEINNSLPYVAVKRGKDDEFFFQGEEASNLLDDVPDYVNDEDYILWVSQGW